MLPLECLFWIWQRAGRWRVRPEVTIKAPVHSPPPCRVQNSAGLPPGAPLSSPLTQRAGRLVGESCLRCELWMRCLWTSSSAEGSVQKWSEVFILVYSRAQGPTAEQMGLGAHRPRESSFPSPTRRTTYFPTPPLQQLGYPRLLPKRDQRRSLKSRGRDQF